MKNLNAVEREFKRTIALNAKSFANLEIESEEDAILVNAIKESELVFDRVIFAKEVKDFIKITKKQFRAAFKKFGKAKKADYRKAIQEEFKKNPTCPYMMRRIYEGLIRL